MTKHTPGPWVISAQYIFGPNRKAPAICQWGSYTSEANARLIAAAPDMLAALKDIANRIDDHSGSPRFTAAYADKLAALIAKAEGGSP